MAEEMKKSLVQKQGYLRWKDAKKAKWPSDSGTWFVLCAGVLYHYKRPQDAKPAGSIELPKATTAAASAEQPSAFDVVVGGGGVTHAFAAEDDAERAEWLDMLAVNVGKSVAPPPDKEAAKDSKSSKMKKAVAGQVAQSSLAKAALLPRDISDTLRLFHKLIARKTSSKQATELENNLTKILVKAYFQIDKNNLSPADFNKALAPMDDALELLVKLTDNYDSAQAAHVDGAIRKVSELIARIGKEIGKLMVPYVKEENFRKIKSTFEFLGDTTMLAAIWADRELREKELCELGVLYKSWTGKRARRKTTVWREFFPREADAVAA